MLLSPVDGYCERLGPGLWAEPLNAATNLGFVLAALVMWQRSRGQSLPLILSALLALIGIGSALLHTFAQVWAGLADVVPIGLFILTYLFAANRHYWHLPPIPALCLTAAFVPYAGATVPLFGLLPGLGASAAYAPVPCLILLYAYLLRHRLPKVAKGLALSAALLTASLMARSLDLPLCPVNPAGSHFLWHSLNALMLAVMIETLIRHLNANPSPESG